VWYEVFFLMNEVSYFSMGYPPADNVARVLYSDGTPIEHAYLDHSTGAWVPDASVCDSVHFEADTHEITLEQAQQIAHNRGVKVSIEWLPVSEKKSSRLRTSPAGKHPVDITEKKWPSLESLRSKKEYPKVTVEEARKMGIEPVELVSDPGYCLLGFDGKPMPLENFEFNWD